VAEVLEPRGMQTACPDPNLVFSLNRYGIVRYLYVIIPNIIINLIDGKAG